MNHEGNIDFAKQLAEEASEGGTYADKFQFASAKKLATRLSSKAYWDIYQEDEQSQFSEEEIGLLTQRDG